MTQDGQGYVYWRGRHVEHYSFRDRAEEKTAAVELAARCRHLEAIGVPVSTSSAVWYWAWYADMQPGDPWRDFLCGAGAFYEHRPACECGEQSKLAHECQITPSRLAWELRTGGVRLWDGERVAPLALTGESTYHAMRKLGYGLADAGQAPNNGTCYATRAGLVALFARHGLTPAMVAEQLAPPAKAGPDPHRYECACCGAFFESDKPQSPDRDRGYGHCASCRRRYPGIASEKYA